MKVTISLFKEGTVFTSTSQITDVVSLYVSPTEIQLTGVTWKFSLRAEKVYGVSVQ